MSDRVKAKKSLGQNFLKDEHFLVQILEAAHVVPSDHILEIGPGMGALTEKLAKHAGKVVAIELDHRMVEYLEKMFIESKEVSILEGNILDIDLGELLSAHGFLHRDYKVVANIPYYITAPIIRTLLSLELQPKSLTLMVQKEVALRLAAPAGEMSMLSVMAQYYSDVEIDFFVPREAFEPVPEVESAVVTLIPKRAFHPEEDRKIFRLARAGFAARRKTLANNLSSSLGLNRPLVEKALEHIGLRRDIRAQALSLSDWEKLRDTLPTGEALIKEKSTRKPLGGMLE